MQKYQELLTLEVFSTRYIENNYLYNLGIYIYVYYLLDNLSFQHLFNHRDNAYESLTREYFSFLMYSIRPSTASTVGIVKFCMFNMEYEFTTDQLAGLLGFPHGDGVLCEASLDSV